MTTFVHTVLDVGFDYGASGGPLDYGVEIASNQGGYEQRARLRATRLGNWDLGERNVSRSVLKTLVDFWDSVGGRESEFLYKDWNDFARTDVPITHTGLAAVDLMQTYFLAGVTMERGGSSFAAFTLNLDTGLATLTADLTKNITAITKANPGVVTAVAHGFTTGQKIYLSAIGGMTQLNGQLVTLTSTGVDTFTIGVNTTSYTTYTSGGTAQKFVQPGETLTWSGEYSKRVRFDSAAVRADFLAYRDTDQEAIYSLKSLSVVEVLVPAGEL